MAMVRFWLVLVALFLGDIFSKCLGEDLPIGGPASDSLQMRVEKVENNLQDPSGVAIRPGRTGKRYEVFVLDNGSGNVVRFYSDEPARTENVITGFQDNERNSGGGSALAFLSRTHLLVMGDSSDGTRHALRIFELPIDRESIAASEPQQEILGRGHVDEGERSLFGIALDSDRVYLCSEESPDFVAEASRQGNGLGKITAWATDESGGKPLGATCVTVNPRSDKRYVVVGMSAKHVQESRIEFYHPGTAQRLLSLEIPLLEVAGLAYGPDSGLLYAIDVARTDQTRGGIYRLDAKLDRGRQGCAAHLIAPLVRPRAMAFAPDGTLYVIAGNQLNDEHSALSRLYRVPGPL